MAMSLISTATVGAGGASSISFTGIPATGKDLLVLLNHNGSASGSFWVFTNLNSTGHSIYKNLNGSGPTAASQGSTGNGTTLVNSDFPTANTFHSTYFYVPNYTSTSNKSTNVETAIEANSTAQFGNWLAVNTSNYSVTSAVTSITFTASSNLFAQNSIASLYIIS